MNGQYTSSEENGLEVDARQNGLHQGLYDDNSPPEAYHSPASNEGKHTQDSQAPRTAQELETRVFGLRRVTFLLSVALAFSVIMAIIAAAVGGSLAAKRLHELHRTCKIEPNPGPGPDNLNASGNANPSPCSPSQTSANITATPSSNCSNISNPYTTLNSSFNLYCGSDFAFNDLMSIFVYTFEDCMNACVSYNLNNVYEKTHLHSECGGVSFSPVQTRDPEVNFLNGNCWLKNSTQLQSTHVSGGRKGSWREKINFYLAASAST
ncbi:hypothetical protein MMC21_007519 [Puttea exsequens]|nr:hypothetical protein [Puttea exsequens]